MILVITPQHSPRLKYVFDFITQCYPQITFTIETKSADLLSENGTIVIDYSQNHVNENAIFVKSCGLLFETEIKPIDDKWNKNNECLQHFVNGGSFGFDIFSAMFHQLSRYEEYLPSPTDRYGRFDSKWSCVVKANMQLKPWVDIYVQRFFTHLKTIHESFVIPKKEWKTQATMDVDIAYEYLGRDFLRTVGGLARNIVRPKGIFERLKVLLHLQSDPSFIFDRLKPIDIIYFIHVGGYGPLDKSCGLSKKEFQSFLQSLAPEKVGLHPSFQSHLDLDDLLFEQDQLEEIADQSIHQSRQHFIKLILPETYDLLQNIGITKDYSMGWPDIPGFRAGTTHPHFFFNLKDNQQTRLELYPFAWMDAHFIYHNKIDELRDTFYLIKELHQVYGGCFTPIFHNNHFSKPEFGPLLYQLLNEL